MKYVRYGQYLASALLAGAASGHAAAMYVCDGADGVDGVEYRDDAQAANCRRRTLAPIGRIGATSAGKAMNDAPPVPVTKAVDGDRKAVMRERLAAERKRLDELRREYNGGAPERRGEERNYARYQARTAALAEAIAQSGKAIAALEQALRE
ncbi:hypothetical protein [Herbaspirillum sp.]|uniref:hypothetical protein n=1 Tax=Herbaspirillum sp. TaxID=1890675 RepID=UPI0031E36B5A